MKRLKEKIAEVIFKDKIVYMSDLVEKFQVSRQAIHRHLSDFLKKGFIIKQGSSRATTYYVLNDKRVLKELTVGDRQYRKRISSKGSSEDLVFKEIEKQVGLLPLEFSNDIENLRYAFTEMLNNAIDHSSSKYIDVVLNVKFMSINFTIIDKGIGVFENILQKKKLNSELDAIQDLLKGKTTTAPKYHSGEGIFFTSKIADRFVIESHKKRLIIDNRIEDIFIEDRKSLKGTSVYFEMDIPSTKKLMDLFKTYTGEQFSFDKSSVRVALFDTEESYVSRSQAKRLVHSLENFEEIELNFDGVKTVGQAFADEVFRVFQLNNPKMKLKWVNANENIEFMIKRALEKMEE